MKIFSALLLVICLGGCGNGTNKAALNAQLNVAIKESLHLTGLEMHAQQILSDPKTDPKDRAKAEKELIKIQMKLSESNQRKDELTEKLKGR